MLQKMFRFSKLNKFFSKTLPFRMQSLNGASQILALGMLKVFVFSKAVSSNLLDLPQNVFLTVTTTKKLD